MFLLLSILQVLENSTRNSEPLCVGYYYIKTAFSSLYLRRKGVLLKTHIYLKKVMFELEESDAFMILCINVPVT